MAVVGLLLANNSTAFGGRIKKYFEFTLHCILLYQINFLYQCEPEYERK